MIYVLSWQRRRAVYISWDNPSASLSVDNQARFIVINNQDFCVVTQQQQEQQQSNYLTVFFTDCALKRNFPLFENSPFWKFHVSKKFHVWTRWIRKLTLCCTTSVFYGYGEFVLIFGSDRQHGFDDFVLIYHSMLHKFGSDRHYGFDDFVLIYHSILHKFGSDRQYEYGEFILIYHHSLCLRHQDSLWLHEYTRQRGR